MRALLLALCLVTTGTVAYAQPGGQPSAEQRRENIKKKIRALRAYTLTEQLSLDEGTAGKLFPILAKWDDVVDKLLVTRNQLTQQLRDPDGKDPKVLSKAIDDSVANQRALWDVEEKRLAELRKILTPAQTAKLLTVLPQFERRMQNQLRRAIEGKGGKKGKRDGRRQNDVVDDPYDDDADNGGNAGGELQGNPWAHDGGDELRDPFNGGKAPKTNRAPPSQAPGATHVKCDPFSDTHGCKSNPYPQ
jgi:hypothetical protein